MARIKKPKRTRRKRHTNAEGREGCIVEISPFMATPYNKMVCRDSRKLGANRGNFDVFFQVRGTIAGVGSAGPAARARTSRDRAELYSVNMLAREETLQQNIGLCATCQFMRRMESDRGSTFYLCQLSATDPSFPKYPRLPILQCMGYQQVSAREQNSAG